MLDGEFSEKKEKILLIRYGQSRKQIVPLEFLVYELQKGLSAANGNESRVPTGLEVGEEAFG